MTILVTGAAGFIGSNFVLDWFDNSQEHVISLDLLTYAGNVENLKLLENNPNHHFIKGSINNRSLIKSILKKYQPRALINFAAETHVDRSINNASEFINTNIVGTFCLLEELRSYYHNLDDKYQIKFRLIHISTDEVYGSLSSHDSEFTEYSLYKPNNPYSATKAASDHLMRAWGNTYNLPIIVTHCSNNFGPYQFAEKLIPLMIFNALSEKSLPIYGDGQNIRDWIYVKDHCNALRRVLEKGNIGETYNIGGKNEKTNLDVVISLCKILDELRPRKSGESYQSLITFINDRPGHDKRYAMNNHKLQKKLNWKPEETFEESLKKTITWYLKNSNWVTHIQSNEYQSRINK